MGQTRRVWYRHYSWNRIVSLRLAGGMQRRRPDVMTGCIGGRRIYEIAGLAPTPAMEIRERHLNDAAQILQRGK